MMSKSEFEAQLFGDKAPEDAGTTEKPVQEPGQSEPQDAGLPDPAPTPLDNELTDLMSGKDELGGEPEEPGDAPGEVVPPEDTGAGDDPDTKSRAFYQDRYQKAMALAKDLNPDVYLRIKQQFSDKPSGDEPPPGAALPVVEDIDFDPQQLMETIKNLPKVMREEASRVQREAIMSERFTQEQQQTEERLSAFIKANDVTQEEFAGALDQVARLGINVNELGGPTQAAQMIAVILQNQAAAKYMQSGVAKVQAAAAGKVEQLQKIAQPQPGAMPEPGEKSPEMKFLESLQNAGLNKANSEVFKT